MKHSINESCNQGKKTILQGSKHLALAALVCSGSLALAMYQSYESGQSSSMIPIFTPSDSQKRAQDRQVRRIYAEVRKDPNNISLIVDDIAGEGYAATPERRHQERAYMTVIYIETLMSYQRTLDATELLANAIHSAIENNRISQSRKEAILAAMEQRINQVIMGRDPQSYLQYPLLMSSAYLLSAHQNTLRKLRNIMDEPEIKNAANRK